MTDIEKAIENINDFIEVWELEQADEYTEMIISKEDIDAFKIAISALEKQIPKKVGETLGDYENSYYCDRCGQNLRYEHQKYCEDCGGKQSW